MEKGYLELSREVLDDLANTREFLLVKYDEGLLRSARINAATLIEILHDEWANAEDGRFDRIVSRFKTLSEPEPVAGRLKGVFSYIHLFSQEEQDKLYLLWRAFDSIFFMTS